MIVKMKKVHFFIEKEESDVLLLNLQKNGIAQFSETSVLTPILDSNINKCLETVNILKKHGAKKGFFKTFEVNASDFYSTNDQGALNLSEQIIKASKDILMLDNKCKILENEIVKLEPFKDLDVSTKELRDSSNFDYCIGFVSSENLETIKNNDNISYEAFASGEYGIPVCLVYEKNKVIDTSYVNSVDLVISDLLIKDLLSSYEQEKNESKEKISSLNDYINSMHDRLKVFEMLIDKYINEKKRLSVKYNETEQTIYYEGWIKAEDEHKVVNIINDSVKTAKVEFLDPTKEDSIPTATKNNFFISKFEAITNMFAAPAHDETDPNPFMSFWYWIIFGIMMGDIGYGVIMVVLPLLFIRFKKPKKGLRDLLYIFMFSGVTTIIAGIVYGSIFGVTLDYGVNVLNLPVDMVNDPLPMLIFSLVLGVFHLLTALTIKAINLLRKKEIFAFLAQSLSWILILVGILVAGLSMTLNITLLPGIIVALVGMALIIIFSGYDKRAFGKVGAAFGGIYQITNYLSDILSYSRILALALSSAVIGSTMNMLAGMLQGNGLGFAFSILVYLIGHIFNFVMGMLSAYVHDGRLQYIEFFGKFYEGTGKEFKPLSIELKYIDGIIDTK